MATTVYGLNIARGLPARRKLTIDATTVPTASTQIINETAFIMYMEFVNVAGSGQPTVSLVDGNGKTVVFNAVVASPGFPLVYEKQDGRLCTGGLSWSCDTLNAVQGFIEYHLPPTS